MTKRKLVTTSIATLIVIGGLSLGALHFLSQVNNAPPQATKYADRTTSPTGSSGSLSTDNRSRSDTNSTNDNQQPSKPDQNTDNKPTPAEHNWVTQTMRHNQAQAAKQQPERQRGSQESTQRANQSPRNHSSNNNSGNKNSAPHPQANHSHQSPAARRTTTETRRQSTAGKSTTLKGLTHQSSRPSGSSTAGAIRQLAMAAWV